MFSATFAEPTEIAAEAALRTAFQTDRLYLAAGGRLHFSGAITLGPDVVFQGTCRLDGPLNVEQGCQLTDVTLGAGCNVRAHSVLARLAAGRNNIFGPFCFIRDDCVAGDDCILGAHLEAARSRFGSGVKISHRAFIGDAVLGDETIVGAGVVFCNYDAGRRLATTVGARVVVGSGALIVPPLTIGDGAMIAAGSVVTKDVAPGARLIQKRG
ncbi:MAG: DapH/DapD/GlmU-related protein [Rhizomicrobium sp.]